ncbi:baseplate J/gp47 family protein [Neokomagataea anthophila]|uniref:Baseplate J/gp47 family protein n=1 Tax=Neokomagataea anthophila TaxID=2826925 RepID=A0ABS5E8X8_9PROT|nr:baseplate J/gp47 family protein [Neokomagataea anthophila]MBR0560329.1 baseplate J/gp47 family protein [Neokomagataea anthophila]
MPFYFRSFTTMVSSSLTAVQASCAQIVDVSIGSPTRALMEAVGGVGLWLQYAVIQALQRTRLGTSTGDDCDSFVADFGMTRLPGVASTGVVTLMSFTPDAQSAVILPSVMVRTVSGLSFGVVRNEAHPAWSSSIGGYVRSRGQESIDVPVVCQKYGVIGNVDVGAISLMGTAVAGIDTVTNEAAFSNGFDAESDEQLRARFPLWLAAQATASKAAIASAVTNVQNGLNYTLEDGRAADGSFCSGYFTAIINDGSGAPSKQLLQNVYSAIDNVRALGVGFAVHGPTVLPISISMTVSVQGLVSEQEVQEAISEAIRHDIINSSIGAGYAYSRLSYLAYVGTGIDVKSVSNVLLNGTKEDIPPFEAQSLSVDNISINVIKN